MFEQKLNNTITDSNRLHDILGDLAEIFQQITPVNAELTNGALNLLSVVEGTVRAVLVSENALNASEAKLTTLIENTQDSIWSILTIAL
jgi:hypothetical protein